jgi:hypothetical protein
MSLIFDKDNNTALLGSFASFQANPRGSFTEILLNPIQKKNKRDRLLMERKQNSNILKERIEDNIASTRVHTNEHFRAWRRIELYITILSLLGLALAIVDYEYSLFAKTGASGLKILNDNKEH